MSDPLQVTAIDAMNTHEFVLYFSDDTVKRLSAQQLADCFPERDPIVEQEEPGDPSLDVAE